MPSTFPSLTTYPPSEYYEGEPSYAGAITEYQDGGADYLSLADAPVRKWLMVFRYFLTSEKNLYRTLAASVRYNPNIGSVIGFDFTTKDGETLSNVYLDKDGLVCTAEPGSGQSIWTITVKLIRRP
jgi:hypothetical protein